MVLIVGENSVWQNTYSIASLSPGTVNRVESVFASAAGKGSNVARALRFLGRESLLLAYVGGPNGEKFRAACEADGIRSEFTTIERETRICTTLIEDAGTITEIVEPAPAISPAERDAFHESFERHLAGASLVAISGTAMSGEPDDCYLEFARRAHEAGIGVVLDSYRTHGRMALEASPEVLKINADELAELSGRSCATLAQRREAATELMARFGVRWVIITRGKEGAEAFDGRRAVSAAAPPVRLRNAIGSGDAFTAGIISVLLDNGGRSEFPWDLDVAEALRTGASMGTANCMSLKPGQVERDHYDAVRRTVVLEES